MRLLLFVVATGSRDNVAPLTAATPPGWVVGWGNNTSGDATGIPGWSFNPGSATNSPWAIGVVSISSQPLSNVAAIAAGDQHGLALRYDGTVVGWGWNAGGQAVGFPTSDNTNGLVSVGGRLLSNVTAVSGDRLLSLALTKDGTAVAWGSLWNLQSFTLPQDLASITAISAGCDHVLLVKSDGTVASIGRMPPPPLKLSNIVAVAAGREWYGHDLALKRDGTVVEWTVSGGREDRPSPVKGLSNIVAIATGWNHSLALRKDGMVFGWGFSDAATGRPSPDESHYSEGLVSVGGKPLTNVVSIAAGSHFSLAGLKDGTAVAWGIMDYGRRPPMVPQGLNGIVAVAAGEDFALALTTNRPPAFQPP
jgi:alpha-tubulin suppressor-like RCC1 family protein